jgi:hypothetical protein
MHAVGSSALGCIQGVGWFTIGVAAKRGGIIAGVIEPEAFAAAAIGSCALGLVDGGGTYLVTGGDSSNSGASDLRDGFDF